MKLTCSQIDIVSIVLDQHLKLWVRELEEAMSAPAESEAGGDLEEALGIYQRAQKLQQMGIAFDA